MCVMREQDNATLRIARLLAALLVTNVAVAVTYFSLHTPSEEDRALAPLKPEDRLSPAARQGRQLAAEAANASTLSSSRAS
jgi:hypothetical protein